MSTDEDIYTWRLADPTKGNVENRSGEGLWREYCLALLLHEKRAGSGKDQITFRHAKAHVHVSISVALKTDGTARLSSRGWPSPLLWATRAALRWDMPTTIIFLRSDAAEAWLDTLVHPTGESYGRARHLQAARRRRIACGVVDACQTA